MVILNAIPSSSTSSLIIRHTARRALQSTRHQPLQSNALAHSSIVSLFGGAVRASSSLLSSSTTGSSSSLRLGHHQTTVTSNKINSSNKTIYYHHHHPTIHFVNLSQQQQRWFAARASSDGKKRDFYEVLGVTRAVDKSELKKAYFKLAKQYHPDTNKGDATAEARFKEVTEAYEVLSDEKKRELYNQYGHAGVDPNFQQNPFAGGFDFGDGSIHFQQGGEELEDIFEAFFGGGGGKRRPRGPRRGADLQMQVEISFEEAVFGIQKDLDIRYQVMDAKTNQVKMKERSVKVDIPAGMESGMNLRLKQQGAEGDPGAPNGNLLVQVIVRESDYYAREGADVHTELPISISQAILGGTMDVKTLTGTVELKIPPGSQPGARLMIRNRGIPRLNSTGKGNHYVHLKVQIPKTITHRQEELIREFDAAGNETFTGRIAHAAESAFEKVFGSKKSKKDSSADEDSGDDDEPKKQAAQ